MPAVPVVLARVFGAWQFIVDNTDLSDVVKSVRIEVGAGDDDTVGLARVFIELVPTTEVHFEAPAEVTQDA